MKIEKIEGVPCLVEHQITILVQDVPVTYNYYDESEVVAITKRLKALGKKYELKSSVHPVH
jgi:hypothetical protein